MQICGEDDITENLRLTAIVEKWPVRGSFNIARGAKREVEVIVAAVSFAGQVGMGEGTPIYYLGESPGSCLAQIEKLRGPLEKMSPKEARLALQDMLGPGAARAALDAAIWDLDAKVAGQPLWQYAGFEKPPSALQTAYTISLAQPDEMQAAAAKAAQQGYGLLKLKLTGEGDRARVAAVHAGAPDARLIVDANESWGELDISAESAEMARLGVEMIEQPLPDGADNALVEIQASLPLFADESCHSAADVPRLARLYDGVNIKLDKAGGLTEALAIEAAARAHDMQVMVGCMLSTSLGISPAFLLAQRADYVDLDGPALLAEDREDGFRFAGGQILP